MKILALPILAMCAFLSGPAAAQMPGPKLTGAEIKAAMFGHTWLEKVSNGAEYRIVIAADGKATRTGTGEGGKARGGDGLFTVRGDKLCRTWVGIELGKETCFDVHRAGAKIAWSDGSQVIATLTMEK